MKSAKHHWWPECVSRHWAGADGMVGWMLPDGTLKRVPPAKLGMIGNGHHIKLASDPRVSTPWDQSFEPEFDNADTNFPGLIAWLDKLPRTEIAGADLRPRFLPHPASEEELRMLTECMVSLAVRSPRSREAAVAVAEHVRGPLPERERNSLIGVNMRRSQRLVSDNIGARAKFVVLFSTDREFIFGDGFFHDVAAVINPPMTAKMLVPVTPNISVVVCRPSAYSPTPCLFTLVLHQEEVERCNHAVQVYSRNALFFRSQEPVLDDAFSTGKHLAYEHPNNPVQSLLDSIPGVDRMERLFAGRFPSGH